MAGFMFSLADHGISADARSITTGHVDLRNRGVLVALVHIGNGEEALKAEALLVGLAAHAGIHAQRLTGIPDAARLRVLEGLAPDTRVLQAKNSLAVLSSQTTRHRSVGARARQARSHPANKYTLLPDTSQKRTVLRLSGLKAMLITSENDQECAVPHWSAWER